MLVALMMLVAVALQAAFVTSAGASSEHPTAEEIAPLVMCPTCDSTLDRSDSPAAERMRAQVAAHIAKGETRSEVLDSLVAEYGGDESILATPPKHGRGLLAWLPPALVALALVIGGAFTIRRWRRAAGARGGEETTMAGDAGDQ